RILGHIATWGTCHIGLTDTCVEPPRGESDYAYFTTGEVLCDDDCRVPTGPLTIGAGHAARGLNARHAAAHYDDVATAIGDVAIGEDEHGIWVAGAARPTATDDQLRAARGSAPSGDWRRIGNRLELVATLMVNHPG